MILARILYLIWELICTIAFIPISLGIGILIILAFILGSV